MRRLGICLALVAVLQSGCDTNDQQETEVRPAVNVGIGVGSGHVHAHGGVGFYRGPLSVYLGL